MTYDGSQTETVTALTHTHTRMSKHFCFQPTCITSHTACFVINSEHQQHYSPRFWLVNPGPPGVLTFQIEVNKSCVVLHVVGDLTLVASVVGQRDVVDDERRVARPRLLQGHAVAVRPEHPLLPETQTLIIISSGFWRWFSPDCFWLFNCFNYTHIKQLILKSWGGGGGSEDLFVCISAVQNMTKCWKALKINAFQR